MLFGSATQHLREYNDGGDPGRAATDTGWDPSIQEVRYYAEANVMLVDANPHAQALVYDVATQRVFSFFGRPGLPTTWGGGAHPEDGTEGPLWDFANDMTSNPFGQGGTLSAFCGRYWVLPVDKDIWLVCYDAQMPYFRLRHVSGSGQASTYRFEQMNRLGQETVQTPPPWTGTVTGGEALAEWDGYTYNPRGVVVTPQGYIVIKFYFHLIVLLDTNTLTVFTLVGRRELTAQASSPHCLSDYGFYEGVPGSSMRLRSELTGNRQIAYVEKQNIIAFVLREVSVGLFVELSTGLVRSFYLPTIVGNTPNTICTTTEGVNHNFFKTGCGASSLSSSHVGDNDPAQCGSDDFRYGDGLGAPNSMGESWGLVALPNDGERSRLMVNVAGGDMSIVTDFTQLRNGVVYKVDQTHTVEAGVYTATVLAYVSSTYQDSVALRITVADNVAGSTGVSSTVTEFNQWIELTVAVTIATSDATAVVGSSVLSVDLGYPGVSLSGWASFTRLSVKSPSGAELISNGDFAGGSHVTGYSAAQSYGAYVVGPGCDFSQPPPSPAPSPPPGASSYIQGDTSRTNARLSVIVGNPQHTTGQTYDYTSSSYEIPDRDSLPAHQLDVLGIGYLEAHTTGAWFYLHPDGDRNGQLNTKIGVFNNALRVVLSPDYSGYSGTRQNYRLTVGDTNGNFYMSAPIKNGLRKNA